MSPELGPGETPAGANIAAQIWNLFDGFEGAMTSLPVAVEMFGVEDVALLIRQLAGIREHHKKQSEQP